jgi:hypothetical protein
VARDNVSAKVDALKNTLFHRRLEDTQGGKSGDISRDSDWPVIMWASKHDEMWRYFNTG